MAVPFARPGAATQPQLTRLSNAVGPARIASSPEHLTRLPVVSGMAEDLMHGQRKRPSAEQCRARAERLREIAETAENDGERRILLKIADDYAELAKLMDRG